MVSALVVGTNTYVTQAEADTILGDLIHTQQWAFVDATLKVLALITAFTDLNLLGLVDPDTGVAIDASAAPTPIKQAQAELAYVYSQDPTLATAAASGASNVKRVKADTAEVEFFIPKLGTKFAARIMALIKPYLPGAGAASISGSFASGTCPTSKFDTCDAFTLNQGLA